MATREPRRPGSRPHRTTRCDAARRIACAARRRCQPGLTPCSGSAGRLRQMMAASVLVVDDDPSIRRMLERTLAADGHAVRTAADGGSALVAVEQAAPDLLVLDLSMPGLDGLAVCRRLRARR